MLAVQKIKIVWDKRLRGAEGANLRQQLPRAFPILINEEGESWQYYCLSQDCDFAPELRPLEIKQKSLRPDIDDIQPLRINRKQEAQGLILLGLTGEPAFSQPKRHGVIDAIQLQDGQFARLLTNGRYTSYSGQHYDELIFNVGFGARLEPEFFMTRSPDKVLDLRAHLF